MQLKFHSLRSKLLVWLFSITFVLLGISFTIIGLVATGALSAQSLGMASLTLQKNAVDISRTFERASQLVTDAKRLQETMFSTGIRDNELLDRLFLEWVKNEEDLFAFWSFYEPGVWIVPRPGDRVVDETLVDGTPTPPEGEPVEFGGWAHRTELGPVMHLFIPTDEDREQDYYRIPFDSGKTALLMPYAEEIDGTGYTLTSIAEPVYDSDGTAVGVTGIDISIDRLLQITTGLRFYDSGYGVLTASDGTIIAHPNQELIGTILEAPSEGEWALSLPVEVKGIDTPWVLSARIPYAEINAPATEFTATLAMLSGIFLILVVIGVVVMARRLTRPFAVVSEGFGRLSGGDFTAIFPVVSRDEIGLMVQAMNKLSTDLSGMLSTVQSSAIMLSELGGQVTSNVEQTAKEVTHIIETFKETETEVGHQVSRVEETYSALESIISGFGELDEGIRVQAEIVMSSAKEILGMTAALSEVSASASEVSRTFSAIVSAADEGRTRLSQVNELSREVLKRSDVLHEANELLASIAGQTNLLAMNAAIEAAHAGDLGKGFAVVADEIRSLAENAAEQSRAIEEQLSAIANSIDGVVTGSEQVAQSFDGLVSDISEADKKQRSLVKEIGQQDVNGQKIVNTMSTVSDLTSSVREKSLAMRNKSTQVLSATREHRDTTRGFGARFAGIVGRSKEIGRAMERVNLLSLKTRESIDLLAGQAARFKIRAEEKNVSDIETV